MYSINYLNILSEQSLMASRLQRELNRCHKWKTALFAFLAMLGLTAGHDCQATAAIANYILVGHVHKLLSLKKMLTCIIACQEEPKCYSVNYHLGRMTCELSLQTRGNYPQDFVHRSEWLYMEMLRQPPKVPHCCSVIMWPARTVERAWIQNRDTIVGVKTNSGGPVCERKWRLRATYATCQI